MWFAIIATTKIKFKDRRSVVFQQFDVVLAKYDDIHSLPMLDLQQLEVWTTVNGLRMAMRNECALTFLGNDMAEIWCVSLSRSNGCVT